MKSSLDNLSEGDSDVTGRGAPPSPGGSITSNDSDSEFFRKIHAVFQFFSGLDFFFLVRLRVC